MKQLACLLACLGLALGFASCKKDIETPLSLTVGELLQTQWEGTCYPTSGDRSEEYQVRLNFYTDSILQMGAGGKNFNMSRGDGCRYRIDKRQFAMTNDGNFPWPLIGEIWVLTERQPGLLVFEHTGVPTRPTWRLELHRKL